ncbi:hypothetical protein sr17382 [Sporisorium reilianum SRZ2]|uniref:Uncharacterized protein n=1 Tax=Sporisorium reilianum (strain SRZ2) TaxID=999809 RepID=E6ZVW3_SPORE|nr:hypothetical protein sr17382 [Sporisorium reilianum SRZ2]
MCVVLLPSVIQLLRPSLDLTGTTPVDTSGRSALRIMHLTHLVRGGLQLCSSTAATRFDTPENFDAALALNQLYPSRYAWPASFALRRDMLANLSAADCLV